LQICALSPGYAVSLAPSAEVRSRAHLRGGGGSRVVNSRDYLRNLPQGALCTGYTLVVAMLVGAASSCVPARWGGGPQEVSLRSAVLRA